MDFNCSIPTLIDLNTSTDISGAIKADVPFSISFVLLQSNALVGLCNAYIS